MEELSEIEKSLKEEIKDLRIKLRETKMEVERFREYFDRKLKENKILKIRIEKLEDDMNNIK